jgi:pyruvate/2-oxoglutarate dehydrogenase complex dihydrolipoamide acyltransferase (E2) component
MTTDEPSPPERLRRDTAGDGIRRASVAATATAVPPATGAAETPPAVVLTPRATVVPEAPARPPIGRHVLAGAVVIAGFFGGFGAWAALAPLASAALAPGRVVVESSRKTVQHLEGGIIEEILVRAGDKVQAGQLLLTLRPSRPGRRSTPCAAC